MRAARMVWAAARLATATGLILLVGLSGAAVAATFTVTTTNDGVDAGGCPGNQCPTLRDAVIAANAAAPNSSTIMVPAGTYQLTIPPSGPGNGSDDARSGDLNITATVIITGAGASSTIIDGGGNANTVTDRVFRVETGGVLELSGATIQHGHPAGGAGMLSEGGGILALGAVKLTDASVTGNFVDPPGLNGAGAGIAQEGAAPVALTRVTVIGNTVNQPSGVIGAGGGLLLVGGAAGAVTVADSSISGNTAAGPGGGIYSHGSGSITITGTTIGANHAALPPNPPAGNHAYGGGLATDGPVPVTLTSDTITSNTADQTGGGILDNGSATYTITNTSILSNAAVAGSTSGGASGGGGIVADGGTATGSPGWTLSGDTIAGNTAGSANHPNVPGGGIQEAGGDTFTVVNTTILGNTATGPGGGYEITGGGSHTLTNDTIDLNRAGTGGGDLDSAQGGTMTLANTIVSRGTPANCAFNASVVNSHDHNLDTGNTCGFGGTDLTNTDPKLRPPTPNGGATITEALPAGSPAVDAGDNAPCPLNDQRGVSRPQNGVCDIGAVEFRPMLTVTNLNDSGPGSLRDAIAAADPGSTVNFSPGLNGQTITLTSGPLTVLQGVNISGPGATQLTINGNHSGPVFDIEAPDQNDDVTISGLTLTGGESTSGSGGGAVLANTVNSLVLNGDTITGNSAAASSSGTGGGGVFTDATTSTTITNTTITNNRVTITGATNSAHGGGGIYNDGAALVVSGSVVSANTVTQTSTSNSGFDGGGGIFDDGSGVTLTNSSVENNSVTVDTGHGFDGGAGVYENGDALKITGSAINGNTFTLSNSTGGFNGGAGLYNDGEDVTVTSSSIDGNSATIGGSSAGANGGIGLYHDGANLTVVSSTIANNTGNVTSTGSANGGGAVYDDGSNSTYLNSTLSGNSLTVTSPGSQNNGGGAIHGNGPPGSISASTIAGNTINQPGGAIFNEARSYTLKTSIVAGNSAPSCAGTGPFNSNGFNLESGDTCGFHATGDLTNTDPKLGPLQDNGGPTPTRALDASSPAIDAGSCTDVAGAAVTTDQRGVTRPQPTGGKCDIGAFELASAAPATPPSVSGISPSSGPAGGGTSVIITGRGFSGATAVRFGGTSAASLHVNSDAQITATSPAGSGTVDVTVTTAAGTSATGAADRFTYQAGAPAVTQTAAGPSSSTGAAFSGSVNPNGKSTTVHWEYGLDPAYRPPGFTGNIFDQSTPPQTLPPGNSPVPVQGSATNLVPNALYHVRLAADNGSGPVFGPEQTFTTPKGPAPPPPKLGTETLTPAGSVFQLVDGKLVPVTQAQSLRSGTVVDALHGTVNLIAATGNKGQKFIGAFSGAVFKITQTLGGRDRGLTTLALVEGAFPGDPTYASCKVRAAGPFGHAALSRRILQTLRASASGRFRTRGRFAAATVRGTKWTTADRCDGTLVAVQLHSVLVNDFVKRINVVLTAGHSYLAKAPKHK